MYFWSIFIVHSNQLAIRRLGWTNEVINRAKPFIDQFQGRKEEERKLREGWRFCGNIKNDCPWLCYNSETDEAVDVWEWSSDCKLWLTYKMAEGAGKRAQRKQFQRERAISRAVHSKSKRVKRKYNLM